MTLVVYKSKYGHTQKYAQWISEDLGASLVDLKDLKADDVKSHTNIIYGESIYAGKFKGLKKFFGLAKDYPDKNYIFFSVSLADTSDQDNLSYIKDSIKASMEGSKIKFDKTYFFRGGIDYKNLGLAHKSMMAMLVTMLKRKDQEDLTQEDKDMIETYGTKVEFEDRGSIDDLVSYVRDLEDKGR